MTLTAEVTITFEFGYNGTNEDLLKQLIKEMRETADRAEKGETENVS